MKYKILQCQARELADTLNGDEILGWKVLAILPQSYMPQPRQQQAALQIYGQTPIEQMLGVLNPPTSFGSSATPSIMALHTIAIVLES